MHPDWEGSITGKSNLERRECEEKRKIITADLMFYNLRIKELLRRRLKWKVCL